MAGFYDYSFNNNYFLFQNPPSTYNNFDYPSSNSSNYPDYNSLPSYNNFTPAASPIFSSSYRHTNASNLHESNKFLPQPKPESTQVSNSDSISLDKLQSIMHNTSEHVQELNQMCQIKEPQEFERSSLSKSRLDVDCVIQLILLLSPLRRLKPHRDVLLIVRQTWETQKQAKASNPLLPVASRRA